MQRPYFIHALSPLHPGTGQAQGAIDLPIARLRGTGIPYLPGSSVKGVLRDAHTGRKTGQEPEKDILTDVFGPPVNMDKDDTRHSGAVAFGDARLLALPVRSFYGTFAWVSSPLLLRLARRDLSWSHGIPEPSTKGRCGAAGVAKDTVLSTGDYIFLEEIECQVDASETIQTLVQKWADDLAKLAFPDDAELFTERFAVVDDETMTFLWECCTQVDARVRINEHGAVQEGALWYEESLPAETLLLGVAVVIKRDEKPERFLDFCLGEERVDLQFGGKATVGRGRARLVPVRGEKI